MISSVPESITNWHNDRSIGLGGPAGVGAVAQIRSEAYGSPTIVTDAIGLPRAIAASRATRPNESGWRELAEPIRRAATDAGLAAADLSTSTTPGTDATGTWAVSAAERTALP
jgi:hypothetical protein